MGVLASTAAGSLLERESALETLAEGLRAVAETARGRIAIVRGEAGIGKTALVRRFCDQQDEARVWWGACAALFTPRPLGPFLDLAAVAGGELQSEAARGPMPYELAGSFARELEQGLTAVVVEDVHFADEATIDVLRILTRRLEALPALIVLTLRDHGLDRRHPARSLLGELAHTHDVVRVDLEPLSRGAVATLCASREVDLDEFYRKTNGNPFFVTEAMAAAGAEIPESVLDAVLAHAARLSASAQVVLEAVAIAPPAVELWLLEELAPYAVPGLDECVVAGMLVVDGGRVSFRHELARLAIEASLPPSESLVLHRRALAGLAQPPDGALDFTRLAHHATAAGDADAVLRFAPAAAERAAAVGSHREASGHYAQAIRFGERLPPLERAEMYRRRADECYLEDENGEAVESVHRALSLYRAVADARSEGDALRALSEFLWCPGRITEAEQAGKGAVAVLEEIDALPELCMAYNNLAFLARGAANGTEALLWSTRAMGIAEDLDDDRLRVAALVSLGEAKSLAGDEDGFIDLRRALELAHRSGFTVATGWIPLIAGRARLAHRAYAPAEAELQDAFERCGAQGLELFRQHSLAHLARVALDQGRWDDAADRSARVLRAPRTSTTPRIVALVVAALLDIRRGTGDGRELLREAAELAELSGELPRLAPVAAAQAEAAWLDDRPDAIGPVTDAALALALKHGASWIVGELACWRRRGGVDEDLSSPGAAPYRLLLDGDWQHSAEAWSTIGCPYEVSLALLDSGEEDAMRESVAALQRLGASRVEQYATRLLRRRGVRRIPRGVRPSTRGHPAGLTRREAQVLDLLAAGLRNREIAGRLYLSVKTVDHHVASILQKLGVSDRHAAVQVAVERALVSHHQAE
jgi:DNA-binding CsgD family transcriptional regulator